MRHHYSQLLYSLQKQLFQLALRSRLLFCYPNPMGEINPSLVDDVKENRHRLSPRNHPRQYVWQYERRL